MFLVLTGFPGMASATAGLCFFVTASSAGGCSCYCKLTASPPPVQRRRGLFAEEPLPAAATNLLAGLEVLETDEIVPRSRRLGGLPGGALGTAGRGIAAHKVLGGVRGGLVERRGARVALRAASPDLLVLELRATLDSGRLLVAHGLLRQIGDLGVLLLAGHGILEGQKGTALTARAKFAN